MTAEAPDPRQSAIEPAEELQDDLEALAASDLPLVHDAERLLSGLQQAQNEESTNQ